MTIATWYIQLFPGFSYRLQNASRYIYIYSYFSTVYTVAKSVATLQQTLLASSTVRDHIQNIVVHIFCTTKVDLKLCTDEREVLLELYHELDGSQWLRHDGWDSDVPLHEWYGVEVEDQHVKSLKLSKNFLRGETKSHVQRNLQGSRALKTYQMLKQTIGIRRASALKQSCPLVRPLTFR